jgi:sugar lactone lactonase YvrE
MKTLLLATIILLLSCAGVHAQSFTVSISPKRQTIDALQAPTCQITVTPVGGFSATATITVTSPSVWIPDHYYPHSVNAPYAPAQFGVPTPYSALGVNMVIVEAKAGPVVARDTCYIEVVPGVRSNGWMYLTPSNSKNPDNTISRLVVDRNNVGWISTSKGIARYDKTDWTLLPAPWPNAAPSPCAIDSRNRLVVYQDHNLARYDGTSWEVIPLPAAITGYLYSIALVTQGDAIWVGNTGHGIFRYDSTGWKQFSESNGGVPSNDVRALAVDRSGRLWAAMGTSLAGMGASLGWYDGTFWTTRPAEEFGLGSVSSTSLFQLAPDGALWALGRDAIAVVDGPAHPPIRLKDVFTSGMFQGMITSMEFNAQGDAWLSQTFDYSVGGAGVFGLHHLHNGTWRHFSMDNSGLPDNYVSRMVLDGTGTIWIGTKSSGLALFNTATLSSAPDERRAAGATMILSTTPNPMGSHGFAQVRIPSSAHVTATLYDLLGREVERVADGEMASGDHLIPIDLSDRPSGSYLLRIRAGQQSETAWIVK